MALSIDGKQDWSEGSQPRSRRCLHEAIILKSHDLAPPAEGTPAPLLSPLLTCLSLFAGTPGAARLNRAPIVLVGGFTGWGRQEAFGLKYWGGPGRDVQEDLNALGYVTCSGSVGPISSNWDRAAELFAVLKGGTVDYGQAHAARAGHARFGRTYPGLLPAWGGPALPVVHLVGHSMGGQTIRVLTRLLAEGDGEERRVTPAADLSPLFQGGRPWVLSLTSIASPHNGTTLARKREGLAASVRRLLTLASGLAGPARTPVYDLQLDQWRLQRQPGEPLSRYRKRMLASPMWQGTDDFAGHDLGLEGASALNRWALLPGSVYAFSWSTAKTVASPEGWQVPAPHMNLLWRSGARFMGKPVATPEGGLAAGPTWYRNDGVVNTCSMEGPANEAVLPFQGTARRGAWNHMGILDGWDHSEILGMGPEHGDQVLDFYRRWAAFLGTLD